MTTKDEAISAAKRIVAMMQADRIISQEESVMSHYILSCSSHGPKTPQWIPVAERQPIGNEWVLCSHPVLGQRGIVIRGGEDVREWANDPQDKSMIDAFWMPLPELPLFATGDRQS